MSNYSYMRDQMIDLFTALSRVNIADAPNYKVMVALCERLKANGLPAEVAERLVPRMDIKISDQAAADDELIRLAVECYADLVMRMLA